MARDRHRHCWLGVTCLGFALFGLVLALAGMSQVFAIWHVAAGQALWGAADRLRTLGPFVPATFGILGASIAGKWVAAYFLVRGPLARGERWALDALVAGLLLWFALDSAMSFYHGALFNVWMINLAPLLLVGSQLWRAREQASVRTQRASMGARQRTLFLVCSYFSLFGVVVAIGAGSPLFAWYADGMADDFFACELPGAAKTWLAFIYAPIGATISAHFLMLAWAVRRAPRDRWTHHMVIVSMLAWFVPDTLTSLLHRAHFNILWVNVPSMVAVGTVWLLALREVEATAS